MHQAPSAAACLPPAGAAAWRHPTFQSKCSHCSPCLLHLLHPGADRPSAGSHAAHGCAAAVCSPLQLMDGSHCRLADVLLSTQHASCPAALTSSCICLAAACIDMLRLWPTHPLPSVHPFQQLRTFRRWFSTRRCRWMRTYLGHFTKRRMSRLAGRSPPMPAQHHSRQQQRAIKMCSEPAAGAAMCGAGRCDAASRRQPGHCEFLIHAQLAATVQQAVAGAHRTSWAASHRAG